MTYPKYGSTSVLQFYVDGVEVAGLDRILTPPPTEVAPVALFRWRTWLTDPLPDPELSDAIHVGMNPGVGSDVVFWKDWVRVEAAFAYIVEGLANQDKVSMTVVDEVPGQIQPLVSIWQNY